MFEILDKHDARECILTRGSGGDEGDLRYYRSQSRTYDCVIRIAAIFSFFNFVRTIAIHERRFSKYRRASITWSIYERTLVCVKNS